MISTIALARRRSGPRPGPGPTGLGVFRGSPGPLTYGTGRREGVGLVWASVRPGTGKGGRPSFGWERTDLRTPPRRGPVVLGFPGLGSG